MRIIALLLLVMVSFAGCASETTDPPETSEEPTSSEEPEESSEPEPSSSAPPPEENETSEPSPPTATLLFSPANTTDGLTVNFSIDASDPDADLASWSLELGDGNATTGDAFPSQTNHTYAAGGTYNVTLTVQDEAGLNATARGSFVLNATGGIDVYEFVVELDNPCPQCSDVGTLACTERTAGTPTGDCKFVEIPEEVIGLAFTLESTGGDPDALFWNSSCGSGVSDGHETRGAGESGTVPLDAVCVLIWEFVSAPSTATLRIE